MRSPPPPRPALLVVIELGASWPRWLPPGEPGDMAVVAQHYQGEPGSLLRQVASRMARLAASGWRMGRVVLVAAERADASTLSERSVLVRGLLAHLRSLGGGTLVLTATPGGRATAQLEPLARALTEEARSSGVEVLVHLEEGAPRRAADTRRPSAA